jgi:hypothetical protein
MSATARSRRVFRQLRFAALVVLWSPAIFFGLLIDLHDWLRGVEDEDVDEERPWS